MPTGIVARMISQASRSIGVEIRRYRIDVTNPPRMRSQSRQKNSQQRGRGGHVQADDEGQVRRFGRGHR